MRKVDYSKLLRAFWEKRLVCPLTSCEADFYFYLLKQCDLGNWANPFKLPTKKCEIELDFSRKTISNVRNSLRQKGFIHFKPSKARGEIAEYEIIGLDEFLMETQKETQTGTPKIRYTYCSLHGKLFNCVCRSTDEAQRLCEDWLVTQDRCYIN